MNNIIVGVGLYIINNKNELLLGFRKSKHGNGTWSPPGGKIDFGESFEEAVVRETKEETNLIVRTENVVTIGITNDIHKDENKHVITIHLMCNNFSGNISLMEPDKFEKWEWFNLDTLPSPLFLPVKNFLKDNIHKLQITN